MKQRAKLLLLNSFIDIRVPNGRAYLVAVLRCRLYIVAGSVRFFSLISVAPRGIIATVVMVLRCGEAVLTQYNMDGDVSKWS